MTAIAIWYERADRQVWAVGDTRVVGSFDQPLTDSAAKLLPLSVVCRQPGSTGFFDAVTFKGTWGFAYAGSTLYALMSYAVANTCLANLIHAPNAGPPSIREAAAMIQRVGRNYLRDVSPSAGFEAAIFGWCPRVGDFVAYKLSRSCEDVSEIPLRDNRDLVLLGCKQEEIRSAINARLDEAEAACIVRAPRFVLANVIREELSVRIGGSVQVAKVTREGFELLATMEVYEGRGPEAFMSLLGFNIQDVIGPVGHCQVGINGTI